ncbi:transport permease protein [Arenicella chitinivorans]|uniref:Transport permease protein n=1 Tax=Arenicella chitinivorans TaxID=1329800 RepID=A0A918RMG6_9GAMM|nr:ABC transporter permease [Arenicella chitinivorans]GHA04232.1 transport permease protein [Arenicella chitinivorans]
MNWLSCYTLFKKEVLRWVKVWLQTVLAPVVTAWLYLLVFGHVLEGRVEVFDGVSYTQFLIPGLLMMTVIQNAFANTSSSMIQSKVMGSIVFVLLPPFSALEMFLAYIGAAVMRGLAVGVGVFILAVWYAHVPIDNFFIILLFAVLGSYTLGALGLIAGMWAEKFDQIAAFQSFLIVPLTFLSGVFYSINSLPEMWATLSHWNPFFYMIDGFRYGFFGQSDQPVLFSFLAMAAAALVLTIVCLVLLQRGYKLRDA